MSASLATAPSESTNSEPLDNPVATRALEWAERWYPTARLSPAAVIDGRVSVLVEVEGDIRFVHYQDLDAAPRCEICGRLL